jgi:CRISPR-associated protein Csx16
MATLWIVTRHPGAREWIRAQGWKGSCIDHLDIGCVRPGDIVMGTLPANLAAEVCATGARYVHLALRIPPELRGVELSPAQMQQYGADLRAYDIREIPFDPTELCSLTETDRL